MDDFDKIIGTESHEDANRHSCPICAERSRLARAYVPMQKIGHMFCPETALRNGTVFPELFMPYEPR